MVDQLLQAPARAGTFSDLPQVLVRSFDRNRTARLRTALQRHVDAEAVPGVVALVYHDDVMLTPGAKMSTHVP